jgi:hypothetical protein
MTSPQLPGVPGAPDPSASPAGPVITAIPAPPRPADYVVAEELDDDICLYRSDTDEVLVLNRSAADVWRFVDGQLPMAAIVAAIAQVYGLEPVAVQPDVENVLADLAARGYLVDGLVPHPNR